MPEVRCPNCDAVLDVPASRAGKKVTCSLCKTVLTVRLPALESPLPTPVAKRRGNGLPFESGRVENLPADVPSLDEFFGQPAPAPAPAFAAAVFEDAVAPARPAVASKYPNLLKYLRWYDAGARVVFVLGVLVGVFLLIGGIYLAVTNHQPLNFVFGLMGGALLIGLSYFLYVCTLATSEFVRVIIDIESGIRRLKESRDS